MSTIEIFEASAPAGRSGDVTYDNFVSRLRWLKSEGVRVQRHTFPGDASWSSINALVRSAVEAQGADCLPIVTLDGSIISVAGYPSSIELMEITGYPPGSDPDFFRMLEAEKAALVASITTNDFQSFQQNWERLQALAIPPLDVTREVQSTIAAAGSAVRDDVRTRMEQLTVFGRQGPPQKPRCACSDG